MSEYTSIGLKAELFVRKLFKTYLEERDFDAVIAMLHEDITWFGTGVQELCRSYEDAVRLLMTEQDSLNGTFQIAEQWYETVPIEKDKCLVYGEINMVEDTKQESLFQMHIRFSVICQIHNREMNILHIHFSVPNVAQDKDEFFPKKIADNYTALLEKRLEERTKMLQDKTEQLERLTQNIYGGVELCSFDEEFTILYMSQGFIDMTGYSKEEIDSLFQSKHLGLLHPGDQNRLLLEIKQQLAENDCFSLEYRIIRKDGEIIWVMDKGTCLYLEQEKAILQCILTDITVIKQQEEALRISKKRYEIAMQASGITMFEYNVTNGDLILYEETAKSYDVPNIIENGVTTFLKKGIILPSSALEYKQMYREIHEGAPFAKCYIKSKTANGEIHDYELSLTNIFNQEGKPVRAIGVRRNVSEMLLLQKEQEFAKNFLADMELIFEADITNNKIEYFIGKGKNESEEVTQKGYRESLEKVVKERVFLEHKKIVLEKMSVEYLTQSANDNNNLITFCYRSKNKEGLYIWYEATVNVVKDANTGVISIRFYYRDINEIKAKEQRAAEEQCLYESMIASASLAYEVNITQNLAIKGQEKWKNLYDIDNSTNYTAMITAFSKKGAHPDDGEEFYRVFRREYVLEEFQIRGKKNISCQYRKKGEDGNYYWVQCTLHLYEDPENGDIRGFSYVEDIDEQKRKELTLQYGAEHDLMTGIYNKTTTEYKIKEYLESRKGLPETHAFLIIDIDHFKNVNDTLGHLFGDDVLKEFAVNLCSIFREKDIVGRVGGDEFCVFMKQVNTKEGAMRKATELCKRVCKTYEREEKTCNISASIGIAFCPENGTTFHELYQYADKALYMAKENGRNRYEM